MQIFRWQEIFTRHQPGRSCESGLEGLFIAKVNEVLLGLIFYMLCYELACTHVEYETVALPCGVWNCPWLAGPAFCCGRKEDEVEG